MARLSHITPSPSLNSSSLDVASAQLGQLLYRLQQTVLHADTERERRLRSSEFERARVESNLDYARAALTKLEQEALGIKAPGRRTEIQGDLNHKRELLELLVDRLDDLRQMAADDDDDASSEGEDILGEIIPTPSESMDSTSREGDSPVHQRSITPDLPTARPEPTTQQPQTQPQEALSATQQQAPTQTSQTLRPRNRAQSPTPSPSAAHSTARAALFANRRKASAAQTSVSTATAEAILDQQRAEQETLSESILRIAGSLKASSQSFAQTLEADKDVVSRAGEGMEKTGRGMDAARGRMGALRKMTEGKGWWGRVILYAWVYGLMVALVLLVFVFPKIRF